MLQYILFLLLCCFGFGAASILGWLTTLNWSDVMVRPTEEMQVLYYSMEITSVNITAADSCACS